MQYLKTCSGDRAPAGLQPTMGAFQKFRGSVKPCQFLILGGGPHYQSLQILQQLLIPAGNFWGMLLEQQVAGVCSRLVI